MDLENLSKMTDEEKNEFRDILKNMSIEDIRKLQDEKFKDIMRWILLDTEQLIGNTDHKIIMSYIWDNYANWRQAFLERFDRA